MIIKDKYYNDISRDETVWTIGKLETFTECEVWLVERNDGTLVLTDARNLVERNKIT